MGTILLKILPGYLSQNLDLDEDSVLWDEMVGIFDYLLGWRTTTAGGIAQLGKDQGRMGLTPDEGVWTPPGGFHQLGDMAPSRIRVLKGLGFEEEDYQRDLPV